MHRDGPARSDGEAPQRGTRGRAPSTLGNTPIPAHITPSAGMALVLSDFTRQEHVYVLYPMRANRGPSSKATVLVEGR